MLLIQYAWHYIFINGGEANAPIPMRVSLPNKLRHAHFKVELKANPYESKVLYPSKYKELDFKTVDKLCNINRNFRAFIEKTEKLLTASERYVDSTERELVESYDGYFKNDSEIDAYCKDKHIPMDILEE
jgi:hypothetical protein